MKKFFRKFASRTSQIVGSAWSFIAAVAIIAAWGITGPMFGFSDTWQLVINTGTTIVTFLMVFLIQNTQNRDAKAIHLKLDELIHGLRGPHTGLVDLEDLSDAELEQLDTVFKRLRKEQGLSIQEFCDEIEKESKAKKPVSKKQGKQKDS